VHVALAVFQTVALRHRQRKRKREKNGNGDAAAVAVAIAIAAALFFSAVVAVAASRLSGKT